ncbi:MAG TPA: YbhB/YbcL family Raf kinase inhibitor-like protein [Methanomicrobia archaeon]|nr:YbhB/YbcL family Raf kinase inhibitor-like protein [Methanomicrobia archaeon]
MSVALVGVALLAGCVGDKEGVPTPTTTPSPAAAPVQLQLSSPEFVNGARIPVRFTCDGNDINPALRIENVPAGTKSLALVLEDPDAPRGTWVHWIVYNIPVTLWIDEDTVPGTQGTNDYGVQQYRGPCPPSGTPHRYVFKLYALDTELDLGASVNKAALELAMQGHILDTAELSGSYSRLSGAARTTATRTLDQSA